MANVSVKTTSVAAETSTNQTHGGALAMVTTLFFMWGFLTCLNDILVPHLKAIFDLNYAQVMLVQFAFFSAYFLFSLPSGKVIEWFGYKRTMVTGLCMMGVGALLFIPAASAPSFPLVSWGADGTRRWHDIAAGVGESLCCSAWPGAHSFQPTESYAGIQFAWDVYRTVHRERADLERHVADGGGDGGVESGPIARVPGGAGLIGEAAISWLCHRAIPAGARDFLLQTAGD